MTATQALTAAAVINDDPIGELVPRAQTKGIELPTATTWPDSFQRPNWKAGNFSQT